jgi:sporadic carbohydrate cluster 2OG-Fe(II) oxygenase
MDYLNSKEEKLNKLFIKNGYLILDIKNKSFQAKIYLELLKKINNYFSKKKLVIKKKNLDFFLNNIHKYISDSELNNFRLFLYNELNRSKDFQKFYFKTCEEYLNIICGNELSMQKKINLSIQMPRDESSILPIHSDVWSGNSPFEIVAWMPLVDCKKTKSMFILPYRDNKYYYKNFKKYKNSDKLFKACKNKIKWINIKKNQILFFSQNLLHGNVVNKEKTSRWSFNCRFKSLFSPYHQKEIGEFFKPINLKPATIMGMNYEEPEI